MPMFYPQSIIIFKMSNSNEAGQGKGLKSGRWYWEALQKAKTAEEFNRILAEVLEKVGDDDVTITLRIPGPEYARIMGNTWLAHKYGEIPEISAKAYLDRAFQVFDFYLKNLALRRRA